MSEENGAIETTTVPTPANGNVDYTQGDTPSKRSIAEVLADLDYIDGEEPGEGAKTPPSALGDEPEEDESKEADSTSQETPQKADSEDKKEEGQVETPPEEKSSSEAPKTIKFVLADGKEVEVPDDAKLKVKIDGKEEEVSQKELVRNYQGKIPWEKHYQQTKQAEREVAQEKITFLAEKKKWEAHRQSEGDFLTKVLQTAEENPTEALLLVARQARKDPTKLMYSILAQSRLTVDEMAELSEQDIETRVHRIALEHEKGLIADDKKKSEESEGEKKKLQELQGYIDGQRKEFQITEQEYDVASNKLRRAVEQKDGLDVSKLSPQEIVNLIIQQVVQFERPQARLRSIVKGVDSKLAENDRFINHLHRQVSDSQNKILPEMTNAVIEDIVRQTIGRSKPPVAATDAKTKPTEASSTESSPKTEPGKIPQRKEELESKAEEDDFDPLTFDDVLRSCR